MRHARASGPPGAEIGTDIATTRLPADVSGIWKYSRRTAAPYAASASAERRDERP